MTPAVAKVELVRYGDNQLKPIEDLVAVEEPLEIRIGYGPMHKRISKNLAITMRTPGNDLELTKGFLFSEAIFIESSNIISMKYCTDSNGELSNNIVRVELHPDVELNLNQIDRNFYTSSSCGVCGKASIESVFGSCSKRTIVNENTIKSTILTQLPEELRNQQLVFEYTGGLHAAALFDMDGNFIAMREDVGRHNALDKLVGHILNKEINVNDKVLLLSGRASFELIQKAAQIGIAIVCAIGAPSSLAVDLANDMNITLVGFLKENRFNIYSCSKRII